MLSSKKLINSVLPSDHSPTGVAQVSEDVVINDVDVDNLESALCPGQRITLKEQLRRNFTDKKRVEAARKMQKKLDEIDADEKLRNDIIVFKYATDQSFLRRSSPDEVWEAILRREAWNQIPVAMVTVTLVQVGICAIIMIAKNAALNLSTLIMAIMYVVAMATSNPFVISKELSSVLLKQYSKLVTTKASRVFFTALAVLLFPLLAGGLACAYTVTAILDFTTGPILDVSFGSMVNIIVNIIVVFSALSIGLRSADPISAIQTFVGFDFVNNMDEVIISVVRVDLLAPTTRINSHGHKMLFVRLGVYVCTLLVLFATFYLTIVNECFLFCGDSSTVII
jgi:hypothetical protein